VASRGLDIKGVESVVNYDMPGQIELYLHRVGRTARASKRGRSISLVGEPDRKMLKAVMKRSDADKVKHRVLNSDQLKEIAEKLKDLKQEVTAVLEEEAEEKAIRAGEMQIQKVQNMIEHKEEILARPKREWFQSGKEKDASQALSKERYNAVFDGLEGDPNAQATRKRKIQQISSQRIKKRKMSQGEGRPDRAQLASASFNIRQAKKALRPKKIPHAPAERPLIAKSAKESIKETAKRAGMSTKKKFVGSNRAAAREGPRSKRGNVVRHRDKKRSPRSNKGRKGK